MSYKIITDSSCDFTDAMCAELDIAYTPLTVTYNGESHSNFSEETAIKAFYNELRSGVTATTSAANPENWASVMEPALAEGHDLLVIAFPPVCPLLISPPSLPPATCRKSTPNGRSTW